MFDHQQWHRVAGDADGGGQLQPGGWRCPDESFGNYSTLNVQNATLSGALNIEVNPKPPPASGAKYTALTAGSLTGSFTRHTAGFTLTTTANSIVVEKQ